MSVVVRMEMPNGCHDCKLRNMVGNCPIPMFDGQDEEKIWTLEECFRRPPWCPIICSLPEGHGDLIDRDVLLQTFQNADYETYNDYCEAFDTTEAAETIVPADEYPAYMSQWLGKTISAERSET